jgi:DNA-binding NarL/FixJ family response regulator
MTSLRGAASTGASPILVIEDDSTLRGLLVTVLSDAGFTVVEAASGEQGLQVARTHPPALVVLDVHLPGVCGYETCRALREVFGDDLPLIFMSGERTEPFDRVAGLLLGADDYVVKPFACDELVARVRRLLWRVKPFAPKAMCTLSAREREVLRMLAHGMDQPAIAEQLGISPKTVGTHIEHIFLKLGVQSRAQAIAVAYRDDLLHAQTADDAQVRPEPAAAPSVQGGRAPDPDTHRAVIRRA